MKETSFIQQNKEKWQDLETLLKEKQKDPDQLSELFIQVSEDLSYARTFYPNRSIRVYLNNITQAIFSIVYKNKRTKWKDIVFFWKEELPYIVYHSRKELSIGLIVFMISLLFGIISAYKDPGFPEHILGHRYIEMTKANIEKGDPLAVYKSEGQLTMFLGITLNNLKVAFFTYIMGLFFSIGSVSILMYNGIMVAAFQYFFYSQGLLVDSFLIIWLHGTIEISCIVLAGGAGIKLGSGLLFPGTYTPLQALRISGANSLKLLSGLAPLICLAGFIESFITRYTGTPDWLKASLIFISLVFIIGYFIILPWRKSKTGFHASLNPERLRSGISMNFDINKIYDNGYIFKLTFYFLKTHFSKIIIPFIVLSIIYSVGATYALIAMKENDYSNGWFFFNKLYNNFTPDSIKYANIIFFSFILTITLERFVSFLKKESSDVPGFKEYLLMFVWSTGCTFFLFSLTFLSEVLFAWSVMVLAPFIILTLFIGFYEKLNPVQAIVKSIRLTSSNFLSIYGIYCIVFITGILLFFVLFVPLWYVYSPFLNWQVLISENTQVFIKTFVPCLVSMIGLSFISFFILNSIFIKYFSIKESTEANSLIEKIKQF
ncbi:MAG: stage II sporulation protein M [Cytophagaceae bacterium]|nr:stage II sporulation protein M [Cytophagaceae bacterium]